MTTPRRTGRPQPGAAGGGKAQAAAWWRQRTPRERGLLSVGALVLGVALLWVLGLKPALDSLAQSRAQLPLLRADAASLRALTREARALQRGPVGRMDPAALGTALAGSLQRAGLTAVSDIGVADGAQPGWRVTLTQAGAAPVMQWLAAVPRQLHVRIERVALERSQVDGRARPGQVTGHVLLRMGGGAPAQNASAPEGAR